jgi:hypothetical protein
MPLDYLPTNDRELLALLKNFNKIAAVNKAALGLTDDDLAELTSAETSFDTRLFANDTAQQAALAATEEKNTAHMRRGWKRVVRGRWGAGQAWGQDQRLQQ